MKTISKAWIMVFWLVLAIPMVEGAGAVTERSSIPLNRFLKFERLTTANGLQSLNTRGILQDNQGFMWFATANGLNRYDGYEFKAYLSDPDDPYSISDNNIYALFEDSRNALWVGTWNGGLNRYNHAVDQFTVYRHDPDDPNTLSHDKVNIIFEDRQGIVWVGTAAGLNKYIHDTGGFVRYIHSPGNSHSLSHNRVWAIEEDKRGNLWVGTEGGLDRFDPQTERFEHFPFYPNNTNSLSSKGISTIVSDKKSGLWIGTQKDGLVHYFPQNESSTKYQFDFNNPQSLSHNDINALCMEPSGVLWVGTNGGGLNRYNPETKLFTRFQPSPGDLTSFSSKIVRHIYQEKQGVLWFSTFSGGINRLDRNASKFELFQFNPDNSDSLSHNSIWDLYESQNGNIWISTLGGGLNRFDPDTNRFTAYRHEPDDTNSLSNDIIHGIFEAQDGNIWISTSDGLDVFDPKTSQFFHYRHDPNDVTSLAKGNLDDIFQDSRGIIWIAMEKGGMDKFDPSTGRFLHYKHHPKKTNGIPYEKINKIYEDSSGILWLATTGGGLAKFNPISEQFVIYKSKPDDPKSLSSKVVAAIHQDANGVIWVGGVGGLNKFDSATETFSHYRVKDGLPADLVLSIVEDKKGYLWLGTYGGGLSRFDPRHETFKNYTESDGLQPGLEFLQGATQCRSGKIYFGGNNGLNTFYPDQIKENSIIPTIVFTDFALFNNSVSIRAENSPLQQTINETQALTLSHEQSVFSIEFAALNYRFPEKNQYAYLLEGFDKNWSYVDSSRRFATYTNLNAGRYTFKVRASNNDGVWNNKGIALQITILPPWWRTIWFRILILCLIIGAIFSSYRFKINSIKNYAEQLETKVEERTHELQQAKIIAEKANQAKSTFLSNMSHDLRTPLNAVLGFSDILFQQEHDPGKKNYLKSIQSSGKSLLSLINDVLDLSKIESGKMELQYSSVSMQNLCDEMSALFKHKISTKGLKFEVKIDINLPEYLLLDEMRMRQILMNLLSNAIKFTDRGFIRLSCRKVEIEHDVKSRINLIIEVEDSGIGILKDDQQRIFNPFEQTEGQKAFQYKGTGLGLAITQNIVKIMNGCISVKSEKDRGSVFNVELKNVEITLKPVDDMEKNQQFDPVEIQFASSKVLIADDVEYNRDVLAAYLDPFELTLFFAENGDTAVKQAQKYLPDLILMDIKMPVLDGYQASNLLKNGESTRNIPIIAVTASAFARDEEMIRQYCDGYLRKPFSQLALIKEMQKYLIHTKEKKITQKSNIDTDMLIPLESELKELYEIALDGNMDGITTYLEKLEQKNGRMKEFCNQVGTLALGYQDEKIVSLLKTFIRKVDKGHDGQT